MRKISTTVYLERKQYIRLKVLTKATGVPMADVIRKGIDRELMRREGKVRA